METIHVKLDDNGGIAALHALEKVVQKGPLFESQRIQKQSML